MQSEEFNRLKERIDYLIGFCIDFDDAETSTDINQDKLRALKLFVHAEIEYYFEQITKRVAKHIYEEWKIYKRSVMQFKCFIAFGCKNYNGNENESDFDKRVENIYNKYLEMLGKNNHGIKTENILKMIIPLGVKYEDIDKVWLTTMNSYGKVRGDIAHKAFTVQKTIDSKTEKTEIANLFKGIEYIDGLLMNILPRDNIVHPQLFE